MWIDHIFVIVMWWSRSIPVRGVRCLRDNTDEQSHGMLVVNYTHTHTLAMAWILRRNVWCFVCCWYAWFRITRTSHCGLRNRQCPHTHTIGHWIWCDSVHDSRHVRQQFARKHSRLPGEMAKLRTNSIRIILHNFRQFLIKKFNCSVLTTAPQVPTNIVWFRKWCIQIVWLPVAWSATRSDAKRRDWNCEARTASCALLGGNQPSTARNRLNALRRLPGMVRALLSRTREGWMAPNSVIRTHFSTQHIRRETRNGQLSLNAAGWGNARTRNGIRIRHRVVNRHRCKDCNEFDGTQLDGMFHQVVCDADLCTRIKMCILSNVPTNALKSLRHKRWRPQNRRPHRLCFPIRLCRFQSPCGYRNRVALCKPAM